MIRRPPRSTQSRSSAASDVYKRQVHARDRARGGHQPRQHVGVAPQGASVAGAPEPELRRYQLRGPVSYTHLRAHETKANLVCRLLLEKKKQLLAQLGPSIPKNEHTGMSRTMPTTN